MTEIEIRPFAEGVEVRSESLEGGKSKLVLSGTAIRYGARSKNLGGFRERVMPGAATEVLQKGEVEAREEHLPHRYLGATHNGTLRLFDTKDTLRYEVDLPDTAVGREVAHLAERGDYKGSSFGFKAGKATWSKDDDGIPLRTLTSLRLLRDVGPTVRPAYDSTTAEAALRCLPAEADLDVEVRHVLEAAASGRLAELLERRDAEGNPDDTEETDGGLQVVRRLPAWLV